MPGMTTALLLSLAWFAALNAAASLVAWILAHVLDSRRLGRRPGLLLWLRLMPAAVSILFVVAIFLPAHWRFEPRGVEETFGQGVYALALAGALLVLRSIARMASVAHAGWQLRACTALPRIASRDAGDTVVYEVEGLAGVSLAGVVRPRILVGPAVRRTLSAAEFGAAVAHEMAHRVAGDNVKRFLIFCAPDFFGPSAAARRIEEQWRASAEWQADARAVDGDGRRAVDLASALVKVAQIASAAPARLESPAWSTLHDAPLLERRVRRLIGGSIPAAAKPPKTAIVLGLVLVVAIVAAGSVAAADVHHFTETVAHLMP
jgi:hypothetical protein